MKKVIYTCNACLKEHEHKPDNWLHIFGTDDAMVNHINNLGRNKGHAAHNFDSFDFCSNKCAVEYFGFKTEEKPSTTPEQKLLEHVKQQGYNCGIACIDGAYVIEIFKGSAQDNNVEVFYRTPKYNELPDAIAKANWWLNIKTEKANS